MKNSRRATDWPRVLPGFAPARRRLSARQREVANLVADGLDDVLIASRLGLSPSTVRNYVVRIQHRLQLSDRDEVAAWIAVRRTADYPEAGLHRGGDDPSSAPAGGRG